MNLKIILTFLLISTLFFGCSVFNKKTLYNSYLLKHKKYNLEQIFNYPSNVYFWSVQDSATYEIIDTLQYKVRYKKLNRK